MSVLTLPSTREEAWRWSDLSGLEALSAAHATGVAADLDSHWIGDGPRLLFVDGRLDAGRSRPGPVTVGTVDAASTHPLARLAGGDGWTLAVHKDGATPPGAIEIVHVATGGASHIPARIVMAEDAQASIVETYVGDGWANRLTRIELGRSARLMRAIRLVQGSGFTSLRDEAVLGAGASLVTTILGAGAGGSRLDAFVTLDGAGAYAEHGGALLARDSQRHDAAVVVRHAEPEGTSRQLWRAVADDQATTSMAARVEVARDAQKTDGEQSLRGLMLKRTATVNLKPELEIFADDVKCAHGATVGELDAQALFYMTSRGITPDRARALLTQAFIADALSRIGDEPVRDAFQAAAEAWLEERI
ncbi:SufD family Fe-S cluster assembly protein [Sphingomonas histidinilytica]|uniref:SufB/SufD family protein n=1 Tax=Rhizorhabdus histidinilytica TaxID=439228 RepID=UPI001ADAC5F7|nr:SufD family Fe-S cluster assembly protein [Rhizorhabdus histidinilytica]MBO9378548.1 SufD family Fe-S cluster assembly protein [Rhizorhabdus histidinilytica]